MAGTGRKTFTAGAVLAAADVQSYLQDQSVMVFDSSAARSSAIGTAVAEGMVSYLKDTDLVESYNGSAWVSVAPASQSGLNIVTPTSIANSGGSASASGGAVTFTGVTSISLNGVFTSTYDNYKIIINSTGSAGSNGGLRLRSAGSDNSTNTYSALGFYMSGATVTGLSSLDTSWNYSTLTTQTYTVYDIFSPFLSEYTRGDIAQYGSRYSLVFSATTSFDGLTIFPGSGNITGKIRVYGYKNS